MKNYRSKKTANGVGEGFVKPSSTVKKQRVPHNKVIVDNKVFDSKPEAERYRILKHDPNVGYLEVHPKWVLVPATFEDPPEGTKKKRGKRIFPAITYTADFSYRRKGVNGVIVEDVKSAWTRKDPVYKIKRKLMYAIFHIYVNEVIMK